MGYQKAQTFDVGKFSTEVHPFVAAPDNVFEPGAALQYGADFKTIFRRSSPQKSNIGLIQLIFPQTQLFQHTRIGHWNVDKRSPDGSRAMVNCLYSNDTSVIGPQSEYYNGQHQRAISSTECWLIDTPREIQSAFSNGVFSGDTNTKFANYVVDLESGKIFDQGLVWGYQISQNATELNRFELQITTPKLGLLSSNNEHLDAIAAFLNKTRDDIKNFIA